MHLPRIDNYQYVASLYLSYAPNDLRVNMYFTPNAYGEGFKGSYDGDPGNGPFTGIATDEVLLIHAECLARLGKTADAMNDLNHLLLNRFLAGTFVPLTAANSNDALKLILQERRKELVMRGARWADLRRLGLDPEWAVTPQRIIAGKSYSLPPKSSLYTFLLPKQVIELSGMQQNVR